MNLSGWKLVFSPFYIFRRETASTAPRSRCHWPNCGARFQYLRMAMFSAVFLEGDLVFVSPSLDSLPCLSALVPSCVRTETEIALVCHAFIGPQIRTCLFSPLSRGMKLPEGFILSFVPATILSVQSPPDRLRAPNLRVSSRACSQPLRPLGMILWPRYVRPDGDVWSIAPVGRSALLALLSARPWPNNAHRNVAAAKPLSVPLAAVVNSRPEEEALRDSRLRLRIFGPEAYPVVCTGLSVVHKFASAPVICEISLVVQRVDFPQRGHGMLFVTPRRCYWFAHEARIVDQHARLIASIRKRRLFWRFLEFPTRPTHQLCPLSQ